MKENKLYITVVTLCFAGWSLAALMTWIALRGRSGGRATHSGGDITMSSVHSNVAGDYSAVGPGYTAVVETCWFHGRGLELPGRVLFFSHRFLEVKASVQTSGYTYVVPSWSANNFLVASEIPTSDPLVSKARIVEFDPESNRVISEYVHPRGLSRLSLPGSPQLQRCAIARGRNNLIWLVTEVVERGSLRHEIEALDWTAKTVKLQVDSPETADRVFPLPLEEGCVFLDGGTAWLVLVDGTATNIPLELEKGEALELPDVRNNVICGVTSRSRLVVIEFFPGEKKAVVRLRNRVVPSGYRAWRTCLIPDEDLIMIGLAPEEKTEIEKVLFASTLDGSVITEGRLEQPAVGIGYGDKHIWALSRETFSFSAYDRNCKLVREQPHPLTEIVSVVP